MSKSLQWEKFSAATLLVFLSHSSFASDFRCTIASVNNVNSAGDIVEDTDWFKLGTPGESFSVERQSGKIVGSPIYKNDNYGSPVVTKDSKGNAFIVLTKHDSGDLSVLQIWSYTKPMQFLYLSTFVGMASGVCEFY